MKLRENVVSFQVNFGNRYLEQLWAKVLAASMHLNPIVHLAINLQLIRYKVQVSFCTHINFLFIWHTFRGENCLVSLAIFCCKGSGTSFQKKENENHLWINTADFMVIFCIQLKEMYVLINSPQIGLKYFILPPEVLKLLIKIHLNSKFQNFSGKQEFPYLSEVLPTTIKKQNYISIQKVD